MKVLADANLELEIVRWLRAEGHDVLWATVDLPPALPDEEVLARARADGRIVITHDLDFGELVISRGIACRGVLLLRLSGPESIDRLEAVKEHWKEVESLLEGHFVVLTDNRVRARPIIT